MQTEEFIAYLKLRGYSPATIAAYRRELVHFATFLKSNRLRVTQVRPKWIVKYVGPSPENPEPHWTTTSRKLAILSSFYDFVHLTSDGRVKNPVRLVRRPKRQQPNPKPADEQVLDALVAGITSLRDRAIVMLFRSSGLRLSELTSLDRNSIRIEDTVLPVGGHRVLGVGTVIGKGGKEREFFVDMKTVKQVNLYLHERGEDGLAPLFRSNRGKRIDKSTIQAMLKSWCEKLSLPKVHPHSIRHAAATFWHRLGIDTLEISRLLGHSSVAITDQYIHPDTARLRAQYFAAMAMQGVTPQQTSLESFSQRRPTHESAIEPLADMRSERIVDSGRDSTQSTI